MERRQKSASSDAERVTRILRNRLALTTILAAAPFLAYGRGALAACDPDPVAPTYSCSGAGGAQSFNLVNNAYITTEPGFSVTAGGADNGITLTGDGHLRYIDNNASPVTSANFTGIDVRSGGAVTISTGGAITGGTIGIYARNDGLGAVSITANGAVSGQNGDGIYAVNYGVDLTIVTGAGSAIEGGDEGINALNSGAGKLDITANGEVTGANDAIHAFNSIDGTDVVITTGVGSAVEGGGNGIYAENQGRGRLEIIANGSVDGGTGDGIFGRNHGGDLIITANAGSVIEGRDEGIDAVNMGLGELRVTADGKVTGAQDDGLRAFNSGNGTNLKITTGAASEIAGGNSGIFADNFGTGDLDIKAYGKVTGNDGAGIYARNSYGTDKGVNLKITTGARSDITGSEFGINAKSYGTGDLVIAADGKVSGGAEDGIFAHAYYGQNLTITTGAGSDITGLDDGIDAENTGIGDLTITIGGKVTGTDSDGIDALNEGGNLTITAEAGSVINAEYEGIQGDNRGMGNLIITANGKITTINGGGNGIDAQNDYDAGYLTVITGAGSSISAGDDGIYAENRGFGNLTITVDGSVVGRGDDGVYADNEGANLTITTVAGSVVQGADDGIDARHARTDGTFQIVVNGSVTGTGVYGIKANNRGDTFTDIKVSGSGLVQGNVAGIFARSSNEQNIAITNDGIVRNLSGEAGDFAIQTVGGATEIDNNGQLVGRVSTASGFNTRLTNDGVWTTRGWSYFNGGDDIVVNDGTLIAASDGGNSELTILADIETFNNSGLISLVDGQAGDRFQVRDFTSFPGARLVGDNGRLAVDAVLAPPGTGASDKVEVAGVTDGTTRLVVNILDATGPNYQGIQVLEAVATSEEDFDLEGGPLNAGFFTWDLVARDVPFIGPSQILITTGIGAGAHEMAAGITGGQDFWHQTTGTLLQRQADLRALLAGDQVTPVADYTEPVAPTPVANVTPGFWFKGVGAWLERDQGNGPTSTDRKQTIYGGLAGFDFGTESAGETWMFGLFGGYLTSDLDFDITDTEWTYKGPSAGAYVTYLNQAFYADLTVKADFLDVDIDAEEIGGISGEADTDLFNIGGQIDAGYKIGFGEGAFIEPQASLAVLHTEIDDIDDIFGGAVDFENETSVRGRLGIRLGADYEQGGVILTPDVTASVWQSVTGDNTATVFAPLTPAFDVSDDPGETVGDVSLGLGVTAPEGWSGFLRGNYQFAADYEAITGNAGVRFAW